MLRGVITDARVGAYEAFCGFASGFGCVILESDIWGEYCAKAFKVGGCVIVDHKTQTPIMQGIRIPSRLFFLSILALFSTLTSISWD